MYKRQTVNRIKETGFSRKNIRHSAFLDTALTEGLVEGNSCLLYTSDAADERSSVDLGGRRIIKKKSRNRHLSNADVARHDARRQSGVVNRQEVRQGGT